MPRPKGSLNHVSMTMKHRISLFVERNFDALQENFDQLEPMQKANYIRDLLPFITAKMASTTNDVEIKTKLEGLTDQQLDLLIDEILKQADGQE